MSLYVNAGYYESTSELYTYDDVTINWLTRVITVPKDYMTLVQSTPTEVRNLDINAFRLKLKDIEDNSEGMVFLQTHSHNTEVTMSGITLARVVSIINGYSIVFEDGMYAVNLVGANSNIGDVVNLNRVSVRSNNSAGLIGGIPTVAQQAAANWTYDISAINTAGTAGKKLNDAGAAGNPWEASLSTNNSPGTFGSFIQSLLTVVKFLGLK